MAQSNNPEGYDLHALQQWFLDLSQERPALLDREERLQWVDGQFAEMLGYSKEELEGARLSSLVPEPEHLHLNGLFSNLNAQEIQEIEQQCRTKDGRHIWLYWRARPSPQGEWFEATVRETTESRQLRDLQQILTSRLQQAQRELGLSEIAREVAHDLSNILTPILGLAQLTQQALPETSPHQSALQQIEQGALQGAALCQQILRYVSQRDPQAQLIDLGEVIREVEDLLYCMIKKGIKLQLDLTGPLPLMLGETVALQQVVLNLVKNASDAIDTFEGQISVHVRQAETKELDFLDQEDEEHSTEAYCALVVTDSGCGMNEEVKARLFDPSFTTKASGHGLGLAAVARIVESHGGRIQVESSPGNGSRFSIFLPCASDEHLPKAQQSIWGKDQMVIIANHEESMRNLLEIVLQTTGLVVLTASDRETTWNHINRLQKPPAFIVLDKDLTGDETSGLLATILAHDPDVPIILLTDFMNRDLIAQSAGIDRIHLLRKPFGVQELLQMAEKVVQ